MIFRWWFRAIAIIFLNLVETSTSHDTNANHEWRELFLWNDDDFILIFQATNAWPTGFYWNFLFESRIPFKDDTPPFPVSVIPKDFRQVGEVTVHVSCFQSESSRGASHQSPLTHTPRNCSCRNGRRPHSTWCLPVQTRMYLPCDRA